MMDEWNNASKTSIKKPQKGLKIIME